MAKFDWLFGQRPARPQPDPTIKIVTVVVHDNMNELLPNANVHFAGFIIPTNFEGQASFTVPFELAEHELLIDHVDFELYREIVQLPRDNFNFHRELVRKEKPIPIFDSNTQLIKGNFCGPIVRDDNGDPLPAMGSPLVNGLHYTPSYGAYNDYWRGFIRKAYKEQYGPWPTMVVPVGGGSTYRNHFGNIPTGRSAQFIEELLRDEINPCPVLMDSDKHELISDLPLDLIRTAFVKWEMNDADADNNNSYWMAYDIWRSCRSVHPDCKVYVHFSPDHGAGIGDEDLYYCSVCFKPLSAPTMWRLDDERCDVHHSAHVNTVPTGRADSNGLWWQWAADAGVAGLFAQGVIEWSVEEAAEYVNSFTRRFGMGINGYPKGLEVILMEFKVYPTYWARMTVQESNEFNKQLRDRIYEGKQPEGYLNG